MARSNNNNKLKAFVRFDGSGRIVPSSLIVQAFKPKVGNYKEIDAKECCNYTTTTTTTVAPTTTTSTTVGPTTTTTTTQTIFNFIGRVGNTSNDACNVGTNQTFYTTGPLQFGLYPQNGNVVYSDAGLTQLVTDPFISAPGIGLVFDCTNGVLSNQQSCF